jgi:hypothetical protein
MRDCLVKDEVPSLPSHPTPEELLRYLEVRAKDVRGATIPPRRPTVLAFEGVPQGTVPNVGMLLQLTDKTLLLPPNLAESLVNDGFLTRHGIPLRFEP